MGIVEQIWPIIPPMVKFYSDATFFKVIQIVLKLVTLAPNACRLEPGTVPDPLQNLFHLFITFRPKL